jgi:transposase
MGQQKFKLAKLKKEAETLYKQGLTIREISKIQGVHYSTISRRLEIKKETKI